jgi:hypothetical protein
MAAYRDGKDRELKGNHAFNRILPGRVEMPVQKRKILLLALVSILFWVLLLVGLYLAYTLILYTRPSPWLKDPTIKSDPEVELAEESCKNVPEEKYDCYVQYAIEYQNTNICALTGIFVDDACMDEVWRAVNDPSICERIYLESVRPNCIGYFDSHPTRAVP